MSTVQQVRQRMIDGGARTAQAFGLNRLLGQIYMLLFMHGHPCCLDEIAAELEISKASISIACRQLAGFGILRRAWKQGDRKDYYEAETNLRKILDSSLLDSINRSVQGARTVIADGLKTLKNGDHEDGDGEKLKAEIEDEDEVRHLRQRLTEAERTCDRITSLITNPIVRKLI